MKLTLNEFVEITEDLDLILDKKGDVYCITNENKRMLVNEKSSAFKAYMFNRVLSLYSEPPTEQNIKHIAQYLKGLTGHLPPQEMYIRVAAEENNIYYNLNNNRVVKINEEGWEIIDNPNILYRQDTNYLPQVEPNNEPDLGRLGEYIRVDKKQLVLFLAHMTSYFIPNISHPIAVITGEQGSAKTTTMRLIKSLVDPCALDKVSVPTTTQSLIQLLDHNFLIPFDNMSRVSQDLSDTLCRAVTGEGFSKRKLHSDDDDIIYHYRRGIIINGIANVIEREDLASRSIVYNLKKIDNYVNESEFWANFEEDKPYILSAIFGILSRAIKIYPTVDLDGRYPSRLTDFCKWGYAIAEAVGGYGNEFLEEYKANIAILNEHSLDSNVVTEALQFLLEEKNYNWSGSATDLMKDLKAIAFKYSISTKGKDWPTTPNVLTRTLNNLKSNLATHGVDYINTKKNSGSAITLTKKTEYKVVAFLTAPAEAEVAAEMKTAG